MDSSLLVLFLEQVVGLDLQIEVDGVVSAEHTHVKDSEIWPEQVQLSVEGELAHNHEHKIMDSFNDKPNDYYDVKDSEIWPEQVQLSV